MEKIKNFFKDELVENTGSHARDLCMLDRNLQSHIRLGLLLSLLSSSILLQSRLIPDVAQGIVKQEKTVTPVAVGYILFAAAILTNIAGVWEFFTNFYDLLNLTAFLRSPRVHTGIMSIVTTIVAVTCIIVLVVDRV